ETPTQFQVRYFPADALRHFDESDMTTITLPIELYGLVKLGLNQFLVLAQFELSIREGLIKQIFQRIDPSIKITSAENQGIQVTCKSSADARAVRDILFTEANTKELYNTFRFEKVPAVVGFHANSFKIIPNPGYDLSSILPEKPPQDADSVI